MSQRHRTAEVPLPPKQELRAHAHGERHRIHVELDQVANQVSAGLEADDLHEPGAAWKPVHHHDAEVARPSSPSRSAAAGTGRRRCGSGARSCARPRPRRSASPARANPRRQLLQRHSAEIQRAEQFVGARRPLLGGDREPEVVLPRAGDLEEAFGHPFAAEFELLDDAPAVGVAGHDADLDPMQLQLVEGELQHDHDRLGDVGRGRPAIDRSNIRSWRPAAPRG